MGMTTDGALFPSKKATLLIAAIVAAVAVWTPSMPDRPTCQESPWSPCEVLPGPDPKAPTLWLTVACMPFGEQLAWVSARETIQDGGSITGYDDEDKLIFKSGCAYWYCQRMTPGEALEALKQHEGRFIYVSPWVLRGGRIAI